MEKNRETLAKCLVTVCLALIVSVQANAQLRFGVKGGYDVISNDINKNIMNADNRLGFQAGVTMELMIPVVGLGGELSALHGHQQYDVKSGDSGYDLSDYDYLRVPLNLKKKFSLIGLLGVFIQAGPYIEFKINGGDFKDIDNIYKSKSFGTGINAGAGIELLSHLELGMYYRKALTDNYGDDTPDFDDIWKKKPDSWSVDLTYFF